MKMRIKDLYANSFKVTYRLDNYTYTRYVSVNANEPLEVINKMFDDGNREGFRHWVKIYDRVCVQAARAYIIREWRKYGHDVAILSVENIKSF